MAARGGGQGQLQPHGSHHAPFEDDTGTTRTCTYTNLRTLVHNAIELAVRTQDAHIPNSTLTVTLATDKTTLWHSSVTRCDTKGGWSPPGNPMWSQ